jgi:hypothetical protein
MDSPHSNPVVEELTQKKFRLECLLESQSAELRKDPTKFLESYTRMQDGFAQPGDRWIPQDAAEKEKNVKLMEEICAQTPASLDE